MEPEKITVMIVEDEAIVAMDLAAGLEREGYRVAGIADNASDALELFRGSDPDILLMDISIIGEKDGIATAGELLQQKRLPVIYLTALTDADTIERAKHTHPSAFLTKPYTLTNVRIAIEMAIHNFAAATATAETVAAKPEAQATVPADRETILQMDGYIFVKHNYAFVKVKLADIQYVEADNNYVHLVLTENKLLLRLSMNQLLARINYRPLVRIHRSFAVNIDVIHSFTEQEVLLGPNKQLPIGRSYKEEFLKNFQAR